MPILGESEVASARPGPAREIEIVLAEGSAQDVERLGSASTSAGAVRNATCSISPCRRPSNGLKSTGQRALLVEEPTSDFEIEESDETESALPLDRGSALHGRVVGPIRSLGPLPRVATIFGEHVSRGPPSV